VCSDGETDDWHGQRWVEILHKGHIFHCLVVKVWNYLEDEKISKVVENYFLTSFYQTMEWGENYLPSVKKWLAF
jgi:hypothetical protein